MKLSENIITKINEYYATCIAKYQYHLASAQRYKSLYIYTTTPIIIFSSITTVLASYNGSGIDPNLAIAVAIFSGLTTIGQALASFVEYNTKYTSHFTVSNKFMNLARMIETEITVNYFNTINEVDDEVATQKYVKYLFEKIYTEFVTLQDGEPYLPAAQHDVTLYTILIPEQLILQ